MSAPGTGARFPSGSALWDAHAPWWKETYTAGADAEYVGEIIPLVLQELAGCRRILDLGCGEGQLGRALLEVGEPKQVIGVDPSLRQLQNGLLPHAAAASGRRGGRARGRGAVVHFVQAAGEELPFAAESFDGILCCLAIEHADQPDRLLEEVARLLTPQGRFLLLVNHPMYQGPDSGFVDDQILGEHYWRVGAYLRETVNLEEVDAGVKIPFAHRPLSRYLNPLAARDVLLTAMHEPPPLPEFLASSVDPDLEAAIPRLLAMRFEVRPARTPEGRQA